MFVFVDVDSNFMYACLFMIVQTKKPRKGAILSKKINDAGDR